jgi:hypothetical protein
MDKNQLEQKQVHKPLKQDLFVFFFFLISETYCDFTKIEDFAMIPSKDCKALLYHMLNENILSLNVSSICRKMFCMHFSGFLFSWNQGTFENIGPRTIAYFLSVQSRLVQANKKADRLLLQGKLQHLVENF